MTIWHCGREVGSQKVATCSGFACVDNSVGAGDGEVAWEAVAAVDIAARSATESNLGAAVLVNI